MLNPVSLIGALMLFSLVAAFIAYVWPRPDTGLVCKVCHATLQADWSHCRACGAPSPIYCKYCHKPLPSGDNSFCPHCGHQL